MSPHSPPENLLAYSSAPPPNLIIKIMGTKKAKKWKGVRVDEETYLALKRNAEIRQMSISQIISFLINQNGKINNEV